MRIARLDLVAFGPFTDKRLDLSGGAPGGLHLVYGRNATGKSSALRAFGDLLFGIPQKTGDDHVHPYPALRIRAELQNGSGQGLIIQRLKRAKDALRDASDAPLDEAVLLRLLGGVDRAMFERVFGLDHERLRRAGQALLEGKGDVGESLFDAGAGGRSVRHVLEKLESGADELFKPRGKRASVNDLLERYKAARKRVREAESLPEAYGAQVESLENARQERLAISAELERARAEQWRKKELLGALKSVGKRRELLRQLAELGDVPDLPDGFTQRRERAQASAAEQRARLDHDQRDLERLRATEQRLAPPEGLLSVEEDVIQRVRDQIGRTRKAWDDLPEREAERENLTREADKVARGLGFDSLEQYVQGARHQRAGESRVRKLLVELGVARGSLRNAEQRAGEAELALVAARARHAALPTPGELEPLEVALALARGAAGLDEALAVLRRERAELDARLKSELAQLAPYKGDAETLAGLRVPELETVERFGRGFSELEQREQRLRDEGERARKRAAELEQELTAERLAGSVPTEQQLESARAERERLFGALLASGEGRPGYQAAVALADQLADRLRREATRVAAHAQKLVERDAAQAIEHGAEAGIGELARVRAELERDWRGRWAEAELEPLSPGEMRAWLSRREKACDYWARLSALAVRGAESEPALHALSAALDRALGSAATGLPLGARIARAEKLCEQARRQTSERQALDEQIADFAARQATREREVLSERERERRAAHDLAQAISALGLHAELAPDEVEFRLDALSELSRAQEKISELARRIAGMRRDERAFEDKVREIVQAHAPELAELRCDRAAEELVRRFEQGRRDRAERESLLPLIAEREQERARHAAALRAAEGELEELVQTAGARDLVELSACEDRATRAREIRRELAGLESSLAESAGPRGLVALVAEAEGADAAELAARLEELEQRKGELEQQFGELTDRVARQDLGLKAFSADTAAEAAEEEQALAAELCHQADRWARLHLAAVLLRREIELYREEHQGPVLKRAGELFARLTRGAYRSLRVGREEQSIVAVRADERELFVEQLNEAGRYQLYLALRLASLESYVGGAEPLPLVLDDVLMVFDEENSKAALGVLGELADRLQILLFTHHKTDVELARNAVAGERLFIHEL